MPVKKRTVAVFTLGGSPAVVTETLWALAKTEDRPAWPEKICLVVTRPSREAACRDLVGRRKGIGRLAKHLGRPYPEIEFVELEGPDGRLLTDIVTKEDVAAVGDQIRELISRLTSDRRSEVIASVAGGRKTMGVYLALTMSLFGRRQDRMYHVLVDPELEGRKSFLFPARKGAEGVHLARIPFPELRVALEGRLNTMPKFEELARAATAALAPMVHLDYRSGDLTVDATTVQLAEVPAKVFAVLALRKIKGCREPARPSCRGCEECYFTYDDWDEVCRSLGIVPGIGFGPERLKKEFSTLGRRLREELGGRACGKIWLGKRRKGKYLAHGLLAERDRISVEGVNE